MGYFELVYVDGEKRQVIAKLEGDLPAVIPPPEPEDDPIVAIVTASPTLTVRSSPKVAADNVVGKFQKGEHIWVSAQTFATDGDEWIWRKVIKVNGANDNRVNNYVAEKKRDGSSPLLDLEEKEPTPDDIMPSLYPVIGREYDAKNFLSVEIDGRNSRQQIGVNMRRAMWMVSDNGAVIDSQLAANGVTQARLIEELDRLNKPNWSDHEPYYGHILRVYVQNSKHSIAQAIKNGRALLSILDNYRDIFGIPYIRVVFCLVDTFNAYPRMVFNDDVEMGYHNGPSGKTTSHYWIIEAWRVNLMELIKNFVPAVTNHATDLIFGWQIMNETALDVPSTNVAIQKYITGVQAMAKEIYTLSGGQHHVMTGLRTAHDIYQSTIGSVPFYDMLLAGDGKYITMLNFHPYCKKPPIHSTEPNELFEGWAFMKADIDAARRHKRPIIADEMGTYHSGYSPSDLVQRDGAMKAALEYLQWEQGVWCCMAWNQMLTVTFDNGTGDAQRGLSMVYQKDGNQIAVPSTPGVVKVLHDHAQANYQRG